MRELPVVDEQQTNLWLWRHGQGERGNRAPLVRALVRLVVGRDMPDDEADFLLDAVEDPPDWLAVRMLPDGRFAGVMPQLGGYGMLGVNHRPGHPCEHLEIFEATWEYERAIDAIAALNAWHSLQWPEPPGFSRRPTGGPRIQQTVAAW